MIDPTLLTVLPMQPIEARLPFDQNSALSFYTFAWDSDSYPGNIPEPAWFDDVVNWIRRNQAFLELTPVFTNTAYANIWATAALVQAIRPEYHGLLSHVTNLFTFAQNFPEPPKVSYIAKQVRRQRRPIDPRVKNFNLDASENIYYLDRTDPISAYFGHAHAYVRAALAGRMNELCEVLEEMDDPAWKRLVYIHDLYKFWITGKKIAPVITLRSGLGTNVENFCDTDELIPHFYRRTYRRLPTPEQFLEIAERTSYGFATGSQSIVPAIITALRAKAGGTGKGNELALPPHYTIKGNTVFLHWGFNPRFFEMKGHEGKEKVAPRKPLSRELIVLALKAAAIEAKKREVLHPLEIDEVEQRGIHWTPPGHRVDRCPALGGIDPHLPGQEEMRTANIIPEVRKFISGTMAVAYRAYLENNRQR